MTNALHKVGALAALLGGCVGVASAQQTPGVDGGARAQRWVVERAAGSWQARCVATVGCEAPRPLPRCARGMPGPALTLAQMMEQRRSLVGGRVTVRGRLDGHGGCTESACAPGVCCNACTGVLALAAAGVPRLSLGQGDAALLCRGDDSGLCCGTAVPAGEVVATGVLQFIPNSGGLWRLAEAALCQP